MLGWMKSLNKAQIQPPILETITFNILGLQFSRLPLVIQQELKSPHSVLAKQIANFRLYFSIREELRKFEAETVFMQLLFKQLVEEMDFLVEKAEKAQHEQANFPTDAIVSPESGPDESAQKISKDREELIKHIQKVLKEISALIVKREETIERLKSAYDEFDDSIIHRSEIIMQHIDQVHKELDNEAEEVIRKTQDPEERAEKEDALRTIKEDRMMSKQRAERVPEVLEKSGLIVEKKDQSLRKTLLAEMNLKKELKSFRENGVDKNVIDRSQENLKTTVREEDKTIYTAKQKVKETREELKGLDATLEEKAKELANLEEQIQKHESMELSSGEDSTVNIDADSLKLKIEDIIGELDTFYRLHGNQIVEEEKLDIALGDVLEQLTNLVNEEKLPISERFKMMCSLVNNLQNQKGLISINLPFAKIFDALADNLENKIKYLPR